MDSDPHQTTPDKSGPPDDCGLPDESGPDDPIEVTVAEPNWHAIVTGPDMISRRAARATLDHLEIEARATKGVGIRLTDDAAMRDLNRDFRGRDTSTDVLSFPCDEADYLGDIALALETFIRDAGGTVAHDGADIVRPAHLSHLVVHGTLHLLGFDHIEESEAHTMEALESAVLERLGYPDPWAETPAEARELLHEAGRLGAAA